MLAAQPEQPSAQPGVTSTPSTDGVFTQILGGLCNSHPALSYGSYTPSLCKGH